MVKTIKLWVGVNGNGFIYMHPEQPIRDNEHKRWLSNAPFCNSLLQTELEYVIKQANVTWENDTEYFELPFEVK